MKWILIIYSLHGNTAPVVVPAEYDELKDCGSALQMAASGTFYADGKAQSIPTIGTFKFVCVPVPAK